VADQTPVTEWAIDYADELNLRVKVFNWTSRWAPGYFDCQVSIDALGSTFIGRSTSVSETMSLTKAISEAVERSAVVSNGLVTSSGVAAHTQRDLAIENALFEIIERDSFLCHYLTGTPFHEVPSSYRNKTVEEIREIAGSFGVVLDVVGMRVPGGLVGVACIAKGETCRRKFGLLVSTACGKDPREVAESATLSCMRNLSAWLDGLEIAVYSLAELKDRRRWGPEEHRGLALHGAPEQSAMKLELEKYWRAEDSSGNIEFVSENLGLVDNEVFRSCPITVEAVRSDAFQSLYFGPTSRASLNLTRLSKFSGVSLEELEINSYPHPIY
jgi:hypothetical protein